MIKRILICLCFFTFICSLAQAFIVVGGRPVVVGGEECSTCADNLEQAFICDDGNADLDDWAGSNNLTLASSTNDPAWAGSNDGLVFDGDDYASFTPTVADWQAGMTVAILSDFESGAADVLFNTYGGDTARQVEFAAAYTGDYNRLEMTWGREYVTTEYRAGSITSSASKAWRIITYNGTDTSSLYTNSAATADAVAYGTTSIIESGTMSMSNGRLGSDDTNTRGFSGTIYRVLVYSRELTQAERQAILDGWTPTKD